MTTSKLKGPGLSPRDRKLLVIFAFFVEAILLYMLLLDPLIMRLGRARELEASTKRAHAELAAAVKPAPATPLQAVPEAALAPLALEGNESPSVAIQRALDRMATAAGVRLGGATLAPEAEERGSLLSHAVNVEVTGPYEGVAAFLRDMEAREPVRGISIFSISTSEQDLDQIRAKLTLRFFLRKP